MTDLQHIRGLRLSLLACIEESRAEGQFPKHKLPSCLLTVREQPRIRTECSSPIHLLNVSFRAPTLLWEVRRALSGLYDNKATEGACVHWCAVGSCAHAEPLPNVTLSSRTYTTFGRNACDHSNHYLGWRSNANLICPTLHRPVIGLVHTHSP